MIKLAFFCLSLSFSGLFLEAQDSSNLKFTEPKFKICHYRAKLESLKTDILKQNNEESAVYKELALAYLEDQQQEQAFLALVDSIKWMQKKIVSIPQAEDQKLYQEALKIYLEHNGAKAPVENAKKILAKYQPLMQPGYFLLNFLLAAAHANLGQYTEFFEEFYASYSCDPDHYMAYKTQAILYVKLYERSNQPFIKEQWRQAIVENAKKAVQKNPQDIALYKLILLFVTDSERHPHSVEILKKVLEKESVIQRADIAFFVQQAVLVKEFDLAQQVIDQAHTLYSSSQVITASQNYLNQQKKIANFHE